MKRNDVADGKSGTWFVLRVDESGDEISGALESMTPAERKPFRSAAELVEILRSVTMGAVAGADSRRPVRGVEP